VRKGAVGVQGEALARIGLRHFWYEGGLLALW